MRLLALLLLTACATTAVPEVDLQTAPQPNGFRILFVKVTNPYWLVGPPPGDTVQVPDPPPSSAEFLRLVDKDPKLRFVQHQDQPKKQSWTEVEVYVNNIDEALAYRKLLVDALTVVGEVVQVRIVPVK